MSATTSCVTLTLLECCAAVSHRQGLYRWQHMHMRILARRPVVIIGLALCMSSVLGVTKASIKVC